MRPAQWNVDEFVTRDLPKLQRVIGLSLSAWCLVFGLIHLVSPRTFLVTVVPVSSGFEEPEGSIPFYGVVFAVYMLLSAGLIAQLSDERPSVVVGRNATIKRMSLLILSCAALVRAVLGLRGIAERDVAVVAVFAEVWFAVAGIAGLLLWTTLHARKRDLER